MTTNTRLRLNSTAKQTFKAWYHYRSETFNYTAAVHDEELGQVVLSYLSLTIIFEVTIKEILHHNQPIIMHCTKRNLPHSRPTYHKTTAGFQKTSIR